MKYITSNSDFANIILNRFIKYTKINTQSNSTLADKNIFPSTECQKDLAYLLKEELASLGLQDVQITKDFYVYGFLPATQKMKNVPSFCLLSHLDTSEEVNGKNVNPILHKKYDGSKIIINEELALDPQKDLYLKECANKNDTIITTDGTTLLGADDKAGITEIISAIEYLNLNPQIEHCAIEVLFSPDEETGHGMDKVPLELIKSKYAYTLDGGQEGQLECECFNAASATVSFIGKATHTGDAKQNGMISAINALSLFINNIPQDERPETTEQKQGFYAPLEISGSIENSNVFLLLRDFDLENLNKRIDFIKETAKKIENQTNAKSNVEIKYQYYNMKNSLDKNPDVVNKLKIAYNNVDIKPIFTPIRGGTDGSRLTELGIPTPNIFTGGHNFHSKTEWASLNQMCNATNVIINLSTLS